MKTAERIRGCLLGGAIGDALGAPVEFMSLRDIRERFGANGPGAPASAYGREGAFTDDTQMTLFTVEGLIRAWVRGNLKGICHVPGVVHHAYLRWLDTQGDTSDHPLFDLKRDGWLFGIADLHSPRAPGGSCIGALRREAVGTIENPANDSKGCGGVMRMAPVGFWSSDPFSLAVELAALTHGHPTGYLAAGYLAELVRLIAAGADLRAAAEEARRRLRDRPRHEETLAAVDGALALAERGAPTAERVESLGAGWIAEEALAISLYCALAAKDLESALRLAVTHSGDSDSTGCITGAILGALEGPDTIPEAWLDVLELRTEIEILAEDYAGVISGSQDVDPEALSDRYPGW